MKNKYYYIGLADGLAVEFGYNVTYLRRKLMAYEHAAALHIQVYKCCGKYLQPVALRVVKGGFKL